MLSGKVLNSHLQNMPLLGYGADSEVYNVGNGTVLKVYSGLDRNLRKDFGYNTLEIALHILHQYKADTESIRCELLSNPFEAEVRIDDKILKLQIQIEKQGSQIALNENGIACLQGQRLLNQKSLDLLDSDSLYHLTEGSCPLEWREILAKKINLFLAQFDQRISKLFNFSVNLATVNIKPQFDKADNLITLRITDLADSLRNMYEQSIANCFNRNTRPQPQTESQFYLRI